MTALGWTSLMSTNNKSVLCCPILIRRERDGTKWERGTALGARPAPRTVCVPFWCHPLLCLSSIVPSYKIPYAKGAIYLPSLNFTMFKAPSSDPVYCFPFSRRQGTSRPSAKTYMQAWWELIVSILMDCHFNRHHWQILCHVFREFIEQHENLVCRELHIQFEI